LDRSYIRTQADYRKMFGVFDFSVPVSFLIEIEHMPLPGIRKIPVAFQRREVKSIEGFSTLNLIQAEGCALGHVVPPEYQVSAIA